MLKIWYIRFLTLVIGLFLLPAGVVSAQGTPESDWRYTVRPTDTLSELAQQYLKPSVSWQALANYNRLTDPRALMVGNQLRIPLHWLAAHQRPAKITTFSGDVQVQSVDGVWLSAQQDQVLQTGQAVKVGRNSSAQLQFADGSKMVLQPQSFVLMDALSMYGEGYMVDTRLRLQSGRVEVHANPEGRKNRHFEVTTPAAVAAVRGTQFLVEAHANFVIEQTTSGQVVLQNDRGQVLVQEGYASRAQAGERPQMAQRIRPAPILNSPMAQFTDFPIAFALMAQDEFSSWSMQVGRDPEMSELVSTQENKTPQFDMGALPDGLYHLRTWGRDAQNMPSHMARHAFEVKIPRRLQGPALVLPARYFAGGPVELHLNPLPVGKRYLVQLTQDTQGFIPIWHLDNAGPSITLSVPAQTDQTHYLWIWIY